MRSSHGQDSSHHSRRPAQPTQRATAARRGPRGRNEAVLQADGPAPSWLVWVGTRLALHFPGANPRLCLDRPGLLGWELGRRLFVIFPRPAVKETHSAAKEAHSAIISRRLADFSDLGL